MENMLAQIDKYIINVGQIAYATQNEDHTISLYFVGDLKRPLTIAGKSAQTLYRWLQNQSTEFTGALETPTSPA